MRRKDKRGVIMDLALPIMTVLFCSIVIVAYWYTSVKLTHEIISPVPILEMSDDANLFSLEEHRLLIESFCEGGSVDAIKSRYCSSFDSMSERGFLTENSQPMSSDINLNNLCDSIYLFSGSESSLSISRTGLMKKRILTLDDDTKKGYNVRLDFELNKEYLLTRKDC